MFHALTMPTVHVDLADRSYDIHVAKGALCDAAGLIQLAGLSGQRAAVISDESVAKLHASTLVDSLNAAGISHSLHTVASGESSKSMQASESLCRDMIRADHDRKSFVIALGGGVIGDLAGFVASIFFRGIPFIQIPTTIVSQVDSSVGGKTGVNVAEGKNLLGCFHQPKMVIIDPETLATLPDREFHQGFAEMIKHGAIRDAAMLDELAAIDPQSRDMPAELIARNVAIKARIVESDEHETTGTRALLNFGHTIGHGIEAAVPYGELLHGEAISLGIRAALWISQRHAGLGNQPADKILSLLKRFSLPLVLPDSITTDTVMEKLSHDKKFSAGHIRFVVISNLGEAKVIDTVTLSDLREAIDHLRSPI
ncbi:MAG: 3-dehydroquinate synthase [Luteolibacter sp.]